MLQPPMSQPVPKPVTGILTSRSAEFWRSTVGTAAAESDASDSAANKPILTHCRWWLTILTGFCLKKLKWISGFFKNQD